MWQSEAKLISSSMDQDLCRKNEVTAKYLINLMFRLQDLQSDRHKNVMVSNLLLITKIPLKQFQTSQLHRELCQLVPLEAKISCIVPSHYPQKKISENKFFYFWLPFIWEVLQSSQMPLKKSWFMQNGIWIDILYKHFEKIVRDTK